ncbi:MAG: aminopeptidase P family protein [Ktedonobacterales bacterium]|nr:aminopeptidase P family protein [Ktedonobacterales bacterium]
MTTPTTTMQQRLAATRARMQTAKLDALLVSTPENRYYLTGFAGHDDGQDSAGRVVITADRVTLLTDARYAEQAVAETAGVEVRDARGDLGQLVAAVLGDAGWAPGTGDAPLPQLGIEARHLTVALQRAIMQAGQARYTVVASEDIVEPLREVKDAQEIDFTRRATEITCQTFEHLRDFLRQPQLTERAVATEILATMLRLGADALAFAPIVAGGANGARPHAMPSDRELQPHEPIIIDMGARYRGYCADMTRTVFLEDAPPLWRERYAHVLAAKDACERGIRAGLPSRAADALARDVLVAAGLGPFYLHGTGHGTGLEIHEAPRLSAFAGPDETLPAGSIITIEPGVYFSGEGGIRIENAGVVRADGCEILTFAPTDIDAMVLR